MPDVPVSKLLGNDGPLHPLVWDGKEHPVAYPCPAVIAHVERLVVRNAKDSLNELAAALTPQEMADEQEALREALRAGEYRPGGKLWSAEMTAEGGQRALPIILWACLTEGRAGCDKAQLEAVGPPLTLNDVRRVFAEQPDEAHTAVAVVLPDFSRAVAEKQHLSPTATAARVERATERAAQLRG